MRPIETAKTKTPGRRRSNAKATVLALAAFALLQPSCGSDFSPPSQIDNLRIVAVTADKPYPSPGETVTLDLTWHDGSEDGPRDAQVTWIASCVNPPGGSYIGCYQQLAEAFADPASASGNIQLVQQQASALTSGQVASQQFSFTIPDDAITTAPPPADPSTPTVANVFAFFFVCAGTIRPITQEQGSGFVGLPIGCFDGDIQLGADSFVPGFTQLFVFDDGRSNENPEVTGLTLDGQSLDEAGTVTVPRCSTVDEDAGCGRKETTCPKLKLNALIADVAEDDIASVDINGKPLREVVWVDYYSDDGRILSDRALVSDAAQGYQAEHDVEWVAPSEAGRVRVWAVSHDSRGGMSAATAVITVE